jgi:nucleosome assembly protein 1-like 1
MKERKRAARKVDYHYDVKAGEYFEKVNAIIEGRYDLRKEDLAEVERFTTAEERAKIDDVLKEQNSAIPDFWFKALKNSPIISHHITAADEAAMKSLYRVEYRTKENVLDIELIFHFRPNDYFTNEKLVKTIVFDDDKDTPLKTTGLRSIGRKARI